MIFVFSSGVNCWLFSVIMLRYLAQDLGALGHPVLGILLSRNNEGGLGFSPEFGDFLGRTATFEHLTSYMLLEDWWCLLEAQVCFLLRMLCILCICCIYTCVCIGVYFVERSSCRLRL